MKSMILFSLLFFPIFVFANPLEFSHWTLKKITCESGKPTMDFDKAQIRYDIHFLSENRYEIAILKKTSWMILRGKIEFKSDDYLCLNSEELFLSGSPSREWKRSTCVDFKVGESVLNFSWTITTPGGGDCLQNDPATSHFDKL